MTSSAISSLAVMGAVAAVASRDEESYFQTGERHVRCKVCGWVLPASTLGKTTFVANCTTCNFHAVVCSDCGGLERAIKGVLYHARYFVREKTIKLWGKQHLPAMRDYSRHQTKDRRQLRLLAGGKS